jgi:hypothetical protein
MTAAVAGPLRWALAAALASAALGCAVPRQMLAQPNDLADYRAFRTAADEGERLAGAKRYLELHPQGAWADEVRAAFDAEEPEWFERAKSSRARARTYLIHLPDGPHAEAARELIVLFDQHEGDVETLELLEQARRTAAMLDEESAKRRRVSDVLLEELAALLDPATWGARLDDPPPALADVLRGPVRRTWGGVTRAWRSDELFFVLPTTQGAQSRVAEVRFQLWLEGGRVAQGVIEGTDLFVRWAEAIGMRSLDPTRASDRAAASSAVADVLSGALEGTLPARCSRSPADRRDVGDGDTVLARSCDGWAVVARMARRDGDPDTIDVRGPVPQ